MTANKDSLDKARKLDWSLLMVDLRPELRQVAKVLHYAAYDKPNAYGPRNWMGGGDEFFSELWSALDRHRDAVHDGVELDAESGEDHIAHMICSLLFLLARKRLENKRHTLYEWERAPKWAQWAATDQDGECRWYERRVIQNDQYWGMTYTYKSERMENRPDLAANWRDSLEARPKEEEAGE